MIVDTSALLAIVFREPAAETMLEKLQAAPGVAIGAPTAAEAGIVLQARLGARASGLLERLLDELAIQEISFNEIHWREAVAAWQRYGKAGTRHL